MTKEEYVTKYIYEEFSHSDMETVKEYMEDCETDDPEFLSMETDIDIDTVKQIIDCLSITNGEDA